MDEIRRMIGSRILMGFSSSVIDDRDILGFLEREEIGGVILFDHNIESPQQLKQLIGEFRRAQPNALIAIDHEGGFVNRLRPEKGFVTFPSAYKMAQLPDNEVRKTYDEMAEQLAELGINYNLAPCVDLIHETRESVAISKHERSFGSKIQDVIRFSQIFVESHRKSRVLTAVKHFPGHGYAKVDTHDEICDVTSTLHHDELEVFYECIKLGVADSIMIAHLYHANWDSALPATLSRSIIKEKLRDIGYDGVLISDDLCMGAILKKWPLEVALEKSLVAGIDLACLSLHPKAIKNGPAMDFSGFLPSKVIDRVLGLAKENQDLMDQTIKSFSRIVKLKKNIAGM